MSKGKDTGDGKVSIWQEGEKWISLKMLLFNFNFDGDELKEKHKEEIDKRLISHLVESGKPVQLWGYTSKKGDPNYNLDLSKRRIMSVRNYLLGKGVKTSQIPLDEVKPRGEYDSTSKFDDDELERSVKINILPNYKPKPKPIPKPVPKPPPEIFGPPPPSPPVIEVVPPKPITGLVTIREVYLRRTEISHEFDNPKPERTIFDWVLVNRFTMTGQVELPWMVSKITHQVTARTYTPDLGQFLTQQHDYYELVNVFYEYNPQSNPNSKIPVGLPATKAEALGLYTGGTPKSPPPTFEM